MKSLRVRDTTPAPLPLAVEVDYGLAYEVLLALSMFTGDESQDSYEVGKEWFRRTRRSASPELRASVKELVGRAGSRWFLLLGLVHEGGGKRDVASFLTHLRSVPAPAVLSALLGGHLRTLRTADGRLLLKAAIAGDATAAAAVAARTHPDEAAAVRRLAAMAPARAKHLAIDAIERWDREIGGGDQATYGLLAGDASGMAAAATRIPAGQLIEQVTGVRYEVETGIDRVLLVPSLVTRPWITVTEWDSTKIFCYRANQALVAPGGPQPDMVLVYRALGDETRLRLLRELSAGDRRLADLVHSLGLAKSTIHAHLAVLRTAGLVRISLGADKRYGLRSGLPDLNGLLSGYLAGKGTPPVPAPFKQGRPRRS